MKALLSAMLVLGLCGLAGAQGDKVDPVGTWKCDYEIGSQKLTATLTINCTFRDFIRLLTTSA